MWGEGRWAWSAQTSDQHIETAHGTETEDHAAPEGGIVEDPSAADQLAALQGDNGQLQHHGDEAIAAQFLGDAAHDELVAEGTDQECNGHGHRSGDICFGGEKHVAAQEMVDGNVPLAAELEPIAAVPPIRVEVAIGETGDFGKGPENVLPDDEENQQKGDHEGEEEHGDGLGQNEGSVGQGVDQSQADGGIGQDRGNELFADGDHEKDAAKDGESLVKELEPPNVRGSGIFELVA